jgi:hypothetical protein
MFWARDAMDTMSARSIMTIRPEPVGTFRLKTLIVFILFLVSDIFVRFRLQNYGKKGVPATVVNRKSGRLENHRNHKPLNFNTIKVHSLRKRVDWI